jgi:small subunit ribosomal protein S1
VTTTKSSSNEKAPKAAMTMADLLAKYKSKVATFTKGQRVEATIVSKSDSMVVCDIGGKSEGLIKEKGYTDAKEFIETLKVGDKVLATVLVPETSEGTTVLALKDAIRDISWNELTKAKESGESIPVFGRGVNASGFVVDYQGVEGFIPTSQMGKEALESAQNLVGKYFKARVMEIDKQNKKFVLSEKEVSEAGDIKLAKEALKNIKEGEVYDGVVSTIAPFGAFVKITVNKASLEGLVHVSEISYKKVALPGDVLKVGDKVQVKVLASHVGKLALSIKQAQKDPWSEVESKFKAEDKVTGHVARVSDFGVFVELTPGVEGLIHITKIPPTQKITVGDEIKCVIEEVNVKDKRIALGLVLTSIPLGYK